MRALAFSLSTLALVAGSWVACVDSELTGVAPETTSDTRPPPSTDAGCQSDSECAERLGPLGPCDAARCDRLTGACQVERRPGCCATVDDCPPQIDPCLVSSCPTPGAACRVVDTCPGCQLDRDCEDRAPPCTQGRCTEALCVFEPLETCCVTAADCDDADSCTVASCEASQCRFTDVGGPGCCAAPPVLATAFSPAPPFETRSTSDTVRWSVLATTLAPTPPAALYLGDPARLTAADPAAPYMVEASFALGPIAPGAEVEVKLQLYLGVLPGPDLHALAILVRNAAGDEVLVYQKGDDPVGVWLPLKRTIAFPAGGPARLVLRFDSIELVDDDALLGVLVDDLQVRTACGAVGCDDDAQCQPDDPCSVGRCMPDGRCEVRPRPGCCTIADDCGPSPDPCALATRCDEGRCALVPAPVTCDDGDPCTSDACVAGACVYTPIPGCGPCQVAAECPTGPPCTVSTCTGGACGLAALVCDDGDPCTQDACDLNTGACRHLQIPGCVGGCQTHADCADADPCTRDLCGFGGTCTYVPDPTLPGCASGCQIDADCDDDDPCTRGRCRDDGTCGFALDPSLPGCGGGCQSPADCDDGRACTEDLCRPDGTCAHVPIPGCCQSAAQCDDGDPCTVDSCDVATGECRHTPSQSPACQQCVPSACDDGDPCTAGTCNSLTGACEHVPIAGCCTADAQCGDGDLCTFDQCSNNVCVHTPLPLPGCQPPCTSDAQCDDGNACTTNSCGFGGVCQTLPIFGCCASDADCADHNACTDDVCFALVGVCFNSPSGCNDGDPCTLDACDPAIGCVSTPVAGCCTSGVQCDDGDPCTIDSCVGGTCQYAPAPGCCTETTVDGWRFAPPTLPGWNVSPAQTPGAVTWWVVNRRATSPPRSLYMGNPQTWSYANAGPAVTATTPPVAIPQAPGVELAFQVWLDIAPAATADRFVVEVVDVATGATTPVWNKAAVLQQQYRSWASTRANLSAFVGRTIRLRFRFEATNAAAVFQGEGIFIDDVAVRTRCTPFATP